MTAGEAATGAGLSDPCGLPSGLVGDGEITVLARLIAAGIDEDRAIRWLSSRGVRMDGEVITDPDTPAGPPRRIVLLPS